MPGSPNRRPPRQRMAPAHPTCSGGGPAVHSPPERYPPGVISRRLVIASHPNRTLILAERAAPSGRARRVWLFGSRRGCSALEDRAGGGGWACSLRLRAGPQWSWGNGWAAFQGIGLDHGADRGMSRTGELPSLPRDRPGHSAPRPVPSSLPDRLPRHPWRSRWMPRTNSRNTVCSGAGSARLRYRIGSGMSDVPE